MVEGEGVGHTNHFAPVAIDGALGRTGSARIIASDGERLRAVWA
jgi:hypothetical protein